MKTRFGPLLAWIAIQLAVLSIGAMRIPLTARSGSEPQHLAFSEMIVVQLTASTLLFPILVPQSSVIPVTVAAIPFLQLAAFLTATPIVPGLAVSLAVVAWILGLGFWARALRSMQNRLIAVAVLNCCVIGGPLLAYLIQEFSDSADQATWRFPVVCDPVTSLLAQATANSLSGKTFAAPMLLIFSGASMVLISRLCSSRAKLST